MSEDFGNDYVSISDEDGNTYELEHLDTVEIDGVFYLAFLPTDMSEDDENFGIIVLKSETGEDGEDYLVNPTEEEEQTAYDMFMERLFNEEPDED